MNESGFEEVLQTFLEEIKREDKMTEKQRRILEASIKLFAEKGFHASSTSEIAKEAGVAEGTIFRHYKSKKDILIAVVAPAITKIAVPYILKDVRKILADNNDRSFADVLARLYKNRLELIAANEKHFRILLQEAFFHEELRQALLYTVATEMKQLASQFVLQRIDAGELRPLPPEVIFRVIFSLILGLVTFKYTVGQEEYRMLDEDEQVALTMDILMNGIARRPEHE
ncbi:TetR/AcrR family transcriptional regulator [Brevibacillus sp. B_LB10_24]|uniref:TetR/AcrR family transcriptional regulator n=1 Tax=Brevibacillus sp. B_LB10_24 TaxID=3380645 RepID=UPI0038B8ABA1